MLRGKRLILLVYPVLAILSVLIFLLIKNNGNYVISNKFNVSYRPNVYGVSVYEIKSSNTMKCNLTTIMKIVEAMLDNHFEIVQDFSNEYLLDIVLSNGVEEHRILYNRRTNDYLNMSSPFLKNYIPVTYINNE